MLYQCHHVDTYVISATPTEEYNGRIDYVTLAPSLECNDIPVPLNSVWGKDAVSGCASDWPSGTSYMTVSVREP